MKTVGAAVLGIAGGLLFALGLLFLVGAGGRGARYAIAAVGLAAGAALLGVAVRLVKSVKAESPDQVLAEILDLARKRNGEVSEAEIVAALGGRAKGAPPVLEKLVAAQLAKRTQRGMSTWFVFADLQPRLFVRRCAYCGTETSIASDASKCPRCGGAFERRVESQSLSQGAYKMDE